MYTISWKKEIPIVIMLIITFLGGVLVYPSLPEKIPIHWNISGQIDQYANKSFFSAFMLPLVASGIWLLMLYVPYADPKRNKYENFEKTYRIIRISLVTFFLILYLLLLLLMSGKNIPIEKVVPGAVSILFIIIGNFMGKIRQNFFTGIRLPWTLSNEYVWNQTHRFAGRLFVLSGILSLIGLLCKPLWTMIILLSLIGGTVIATVVYSLIIYYRNKDTPSEVIN